MTIISIIMFIFAGCLLLYALIAGLTKRLPFLPETPYSLTNRPQQYFIRFAWLLALLSLAFIISGIIGLFEHLVIVAVIAFVVLFVIFLIIGIKVIMRGYTE